MRFLFVILILLSGFQVAQAAVVGDGTVSSCTNAALISAINNAAETDTITFNCGGNVTLPISETLKLRGKNLTIDGGNTITLQGVAGTRIIDFDTWGFNAARTVTLRNMVIRDASRSGAGEEANGAAVLVKNQSANWENDLPTLVVDNVRFENNSTALSANPADPLQPYDFGGGAIYILGGILRVNNSTFINNMVHGGTGGAIHGLGSAIKITNSTFSGNTATPLSSSDPNSGFGGALYVDGTLARGGGSVKIAHSTFDANHAANQGGVMYVNLYSFRSEKIKINNSRFINNSVSGGEMGWGGAISGGGTGGAVNFKITNSLFAHNTANSAPEHPGGDGGAVALPQPVNLVVANSTFHNNYADLNCSGSNCFSGRAGALYVNGNFRILNSTIANNRAGWFAGAIIGENGTLINTIIANNTSENRGGTPDFAQQCQTAYGGTHNLQFPAGAGCTNGILTGDPLLGDLTGDTLPLMNGSAAINRGNAVICARPPVNGRDQRGVSRPQGDQCDIGAFELEGSAPQVPVLIAPSNGANGVSLNPTFSWNRVTDATQYQVKVINNNGVVIHKQKLTASEANCVTETPCQYVMTGFTLSGGKAYRWQVLAINEFGKRKSAKSSFQTG